eukprot:5967618-Prorocentrum_lima.AAC.1
MLSRVHRCSSSPGASNSSAKSLSSAASAIGRFEGRNISDLESLGNAMLCYYPHARGAQRTGGTRGLRGTGEGGNGRGHGPLRSHRSYCFT